MFVSRVVYPLGGTKILFIPSKTVNAISCAAHRFDFRMFCCACRPFEKTNKPCLLLTLCFLFPLLVHIQNAFVCIYLINGFTQLIDLSTTLSDVAGYTHRYQAAYLNSPLWGQMMTAGFVYTVHLSITVCVCVLRSGSGSWGRWWMTSYASSATTTQHQEKATTLTGLCGHIILCCVKKRSTVWWFKKQAACEENLLDYIKHTEMEMGKDGKNSCLYQNLWASTTSHITTSPHSDFNIHAGPVDTAFIVDHLSYKSPFSDELLVEDLNLKISQGSHLLVVGNTGTGKTSLLRVLNRLWEAHSGESRRTETVWPNLIFFYYCINSLANREKRRLHKKGQ